MQRDTLKAFLQDDIFRVYLKSNYPLTDTDIDNITMTTPDKIIEIIIIKELINKRSNSQTTNIAASQINNLLDSRLK